MTKNSISAFCALGLLAAAVAFHATLSPLAAKAQSAASSNSPAAATSASSSKLYVVPDLAERVAKFKPVHMPFHSQGLTAREREMIEKLVDASGLLDCIYWRQSDPEGLKLYLSLAKSKNPQDELLRRYLRINGSRFDLIDNEKPFVGTQPMPPGRGFYPEDLTKQKLDAYIAAHPDQKTALYGPFAVVRNKPHSADGSELIAVSYHVEYRQFLEPMAKDLREAADLSDDPAFAKFLRLRADALLTDDYYASDIAWLDLENPKFDVVFAPYETYHRLAAGRENLLRRFGDDPQRCREPEARAVPEIHARFAGGASAARRRTCLPSAASNRLWK